MSLLSLELLLETAAPTKVVVVYDFYNARPVVWRFENGTSDFLEALHKITGTKDDKSYEVLKQIIIKGDLGRIGTGQKIFFYFGDEGQFWFDNVTHISLPTGQPK
jgi:hypothetical protein